MKNQENMRKQLKKLHRNSMLDSFFAVSCSCGKCSCYCSCTQPTLRVDNDAAPETSRTVSYFTDYAAMN